MADIKRKLRPKVMNSIQVKPRVTKAATHSSFAEVGSRKIEIDSSSQKRKRLRKKNSSISSVKRKPVLIISEPLSEKIHEPKFKKKNYLFFFYVFILENKKTWLRLLLFLLFCLFLFTVSNRFHNSEVHYTLTRQEVNLKKKVRFYLRPGKNQYPFYISSLENKSEIDSVLSDYTETNSPSRGLVRILNNYSTQPQKLSKNTRFESVSGDIFFVENEIVIPGKKGSIPGSLDVELVSQGRGALQNIDLTDFTIPGFKELGLDRKFENIYALSIEKFSGAGKVRKYTIGSELEKDIQEDLRKINTSFVVDRVYKELDGRFYVPKKSAVILHGKISHQQDDSKLLSSQSSFMSVPLLSKDSLKEIVTLDIADSINYDFDISNPENIVATLAEQASDYRDASYLDIYISYSGEVKASLDQAFTSSLLSENLQSLHELSILHVSIKSLDVKTKPFWKSSFPTNPEAIRFTEKA